MWACIAFFALDLDRGNLSQANTDNFLEDLGLTTNGMFSPHLLTRIGTYTYHQTDYNLGNTVFRVAFLSAELPSQLVSKKVGPDRWVCFTMRTITESTLNCLTDPNYHGALEHRCSLAILAHWSVNLPRVPRTSWNASRRFVRALNALKTCSSSLITPISIPDMILYLSFFFKGTELPFRLALFWTTLRIVDVIAPILAFGLLRLRGLHGYEGWRWLFLIEGLFTLAVGVWSWFMMAASPTQTKSWYRPKGWFTEKEEKMMVNRILRDDPSKGDMHNRQAVDFKQLWKSICDFDIWPIYFLGLVFQIPVGPPDQYLTLTLRNLGFDTFDSNLLSIPSQAAGAVTVSYQRILTMIKRLTMGRC